VFGVWIWVGGRSESETGVDLGRSQLLLSGVEANVLRVVCCAISSSGCAVGLIDKKFVLGEERYHRSWFVNERFFIESASLTKKKY